MLDGEEVYCPVDLDSSVKIALGWSGKFPCRLWHVPSIEGVCGAGACEAWHLRFDVGDRVRALHHDSCWKYGTIVELNVVEEGVLYPYEV